MMRILQPQNFVLLDKTRKSIHLKYENANNREILFCIFQCEFRTCSHACQLIHVKPIYFAQAIWDRVSFLRVIFQVHLDFPNQSYRYVFNGKVISLQSSLPGSKKKWQGKGTCWDIISSKQMMEVFWLQVNKFFLLDWRFC